MTVVILGVGNLLLSDEGFGVHVVRELERQATVLPQSVVVVDGGTLGLELLPIVQDADALVLVDAIDLGRAPGTLSSFLGAEIEATLNRHVSPHQVGAADLIGVARLTGVLPERTALVGVQPQSLDFSLELTSPVRAALPRAVQEVLAVAREFALEDAYA